MIMGLDLERRTPTIADIDHAGILAWWDDHVFTGCRQATKMYSR
jgi:hypothetical protein